MLQVRRGTGSCSSAGMHPLCIAPAEGTMEQRPATLPEPALRLGLALQGGGLHGAFGWGVLHELLEDETIEISALSGTSAGRSMRWCSPMAGLPAPPIRGAGPRMRWRGAAHPTARDATRPR